MSTRTAAWLAWAVCALSLALTALSFLLIALSLRQNAPIFFYWLECTLFAVGYSVIGAIIASRLPNHPIITGNPRRIVGYPGGRDHPHSGQRTGSLPARDTGSEQARPLIFAPAPYVNIFSIVGVRHLKGLPEKMRAKEDRASGA
jgi:hypothetical protein